MAEETSFKKPTPSAQLPRLPTKPADPKRHLRQGPVDRWIPFGWDSFAANLSLSSPYGVEYTLARCTFASEQVFFTTAEPALVGNPKCANA